MAFEPDSMKRIGSTGIAAYNRVWNTPVGSGRRFQITCDGKVMAGYDTQQEAQEICKSYSSTERNKSYSWIVMDRG
jgi:hypothetical protein